MAVSSTALRVYCSLTKLKGKVHSCAGLPSEAQRPSAGRGGRTAPPHSGKFLANHYLIREALALVHIHDKDTSQNPQESLSSCKNGGLHLHPRKLKQGPAATKTKTLNP